MVKARLNLVLGGRVEIDASGVRLPNSIDQGFITYMTNAFLGTEPLISSYQVYDSFNNVKAPAKVVNVQTATNSITFQFRAFLVDVPNSVYRFNLQAVLTDRKVVTIASFTTTLNSNSSSIVVDWYITVYLNTYEFGGIVVDFQPLYNFLKDFFYSPSSLSQNVPVFSVIPPPTFVQQNGLTFIAVYSSYPNGTCEVVDMTATLSLLFFPVLQFSYLFNCTPSPSILNFFEFSINIST